MWCSYLFFCYIGNPKFLFSKWDFKKGTNVIGIKVQSKGTKNVFGFWIDVYRNKKLVGTCYQRCHHFFVSGHQPVECVQNMRWWSSNLRQWPLLNLGSVAYCYLLVYLTRPTLSYRFLMYFSGGQPPPASTPPPPKRICTGWSSYPGVTCLRPRIPMHPTSPLFFSVRDSPLQPYLAPATPAGFLLPSHPCRFQNCLYREPKIILRCLLPWTWHPESPPSLVTCLSRTNTKNRPVGHPLRHCLLSPVTCRLSPVKICPERLCPLSL